MAGGQRFQARVTAWWATRILLESHVGSGYALAITARAERIWCETKDGVDDIRVELLGPAGPATIFGQCKRSLSVGKDADGEWAKVLLQFARQKVADDAGDAKSVDGATLVRRYALFHEADNGTLRRLAALLHRYRGLPDGSSFDAAALNAEEAELVTKITELLNALAVAHAGRDIESVLSGDREQLLRRMTVTQLRLGDGETDAVSLQDGLQHGLLTDAADIPATLYSLRTLADDLLADRGSRDRVALRDRLVGAGIGLRGAVSFIADLQRMAAFSDDEFRAHEAEGRRELRLGAERVVIDRPELLHRIDSAPGSSLLVAGNAGVGKTGALMNIVDALRGRGTRVWYWAADSLPEASLPAMQTHLGLLHPWNALFGEAVASGPLVLVIDGLDGLREAAAMRAYKKLIGLARLRGVTVIASMRTVDLEFATELKQLFATDDGGQPGTQINSITISDLDEAAFQTVVTKLPDVQRALATVPSLAPVVRNLFSMDLLCQLLGSGESATQLSGIGTQAELFDRYWKRRIDDHPHRNAWIDALNEVVASMVNQRRLQIDEPSGRAGALGELRSVGVLRTPAALPGRMAIAGRVEFTHHLLFDYAAERLFIRPRRADLGTELTPDNPWPLMLRPSLVLYFRHLWTTARLDFWDTLAAIERANATGLHRFAAYTVVAAEARSCDDFAPLLTGTVGNESAVWRRALRGVVVVAPFTSLGRLFGDGTGEWWITLARDLLATDDHDLAYLGRRILFSAGDCIATLPPVMQRALNDAAIILVRLQRRKESPSLAMVPAIEWVCKTFAADETATSALIRELIEPAEVARSGYIILRVLADHVETIASRDPILAREVYEAAFAYQEESKADTPMGGVIVAMRSNRRQDYDMAIHRLGEQFPKLLSASLVEGTRVAVAIVQQLASRSGRVLIEKLPADEFVVDGRQYALRDDRHSQLHASGWRGDASEKALEAWQKAVVDLGRSAATTPTASAYLFARMYAVCLAENLFATLWGHLLRAAAEVPTFFAPRLWPLLTQPALIARKTIIEAVASAIEAFAPRLDDAALGAIESAIVGLFDHEDDYMKGRAGAKRVKAYLLPKIPAGRRSAAANNVLDGVGTTTAAPTDKPVIRVSSLRVSTESLLEDAGVDIGDPAHVTVLRDIAELEMPEGEREDTSNPDDMLATVRRIEAALENPTAEVHQKVAEVARSRVMRAASEVAQCKGPLPDAAVADLITRFRAGLSSTSDAPDDNDAKQFDRMPFWGSDEVRVNAASGIVGLALRPGGARLYERDLDQIARDAEPQVRMQLASNLWRFAGTSPEFVWTTLEAWAVDLPQSGHASVVRLALPQGWLWWLRKRDERRADALLVQLLDGAHANGDQQLQELLGHYFGAFCYDYGTPEAKARLSAMLVDTSASADELRGMVRQILSRIWPRQGPRIETDLAVALRARALVIDILTALQKRLSVYDAAWRALPPEQRPTEHPAWVASHAGVFHVASSEFRIASIAWARAVVPPEDASRLCELDDGGAAPEEEDNGKPGNVAAMASVPTVAELDAWLADATPVLDTVVSFPQANSAYDLIQAADAIALACPIRALRLLHNVTEASAKTGILSESMAADGTIETLSRILVRDDGTLAGDVASRSSFLFILEAYLDVGWPRAIALALQIEAIFRTAK